MLLCGMKHVYVCGIHNLEFPKQSGEHHIGSTAGSKLSDGNPWWIRMLGKGKWGQHYSEKHKMKVLREDFVQEMRIVRSVFDCNHLYMHI